MSVSIRNPWTLSLALGWLTVAGLQVWVDVGLEAWSALDLALACLFTWCSANGHRFELGDDRFKVSVWGIMWREFPYDGFVERSPGELRLGTSRFKWTLPTVGMEEKLDRLATELGSRGAAIDHGSLKRFLWWWD